MDGRSTNALTTLCSAISQRAISIVHEVQVFIEPLGSGLDRVSENKLSELKNALEELKDQASQLDASLRTATVSMAAHDAFLQHLTTCDGTLAILYKQVLRLQAETLDRVNIEFLVAYNQTIQANSQLLEGFVRVAAIGNAQQQEASLGLLRSKGLITQVERSSKASTAQSDILLELGESSFASGSGSSSNPPPASRIAAPPPYSMEAGPSSPSSSTAPAKSSWGKSLKNSFKSLASTLKPGPEPFVSALCQAASIGDIQQIAGFLNQGANINGRNEDGKTALQCAILKDREEASRFLLASGANVYGAKRHDKHLPPLFLAASVGSLNTARMLIEKGASIDEKYDSGESYFVTVVSSGNLEGIRFLLKQGCSAKTDDISGQAVIVRAVEKKNTKLVELLLEFGANVTSTDSAGRSLLTVALDKKDYEMAELLLKLDANPNDITIYGNPLLADEISHRRIKTAKLLLDWGADANMTDWHSQPVLLLAIKDSKLSQEDKLDIVRYLFAKGAKGNVYDSTSEGPAISYAMETGLPELVSLVLRHGGKTTEQMSNGDSLLKYAIDQGRRDLVETLLLYGADPDYNPGKNGITPVKPLVQALVKQDFELIRLLREAGADTKSPEVADVAKALGRVEVYEALGIRHMPPPPDDGNPPNYDTATRN
ncbi:ankyrin repeat-containing domain protein [Trichoderma evansii]